MVDVVRPASLPRGGPSYADPRPIEALSLSRCEDRPEERRVGAGAAVSPHYSRNQVAHDGCLASVGAFERRNARTRDRNIFVAPASSTFDTLTDTPFKSEGIRLMA